MKAVPHHCIRTNRRSHRSVPSTFGQVVLQSFLAATICCGTTRAQETKGAATEDASVTKFAGLWNGSYYQNSWKTNYSMLLEIRPVKDREISVTTEWLMFGSRVRTSGTGIVTPDCASWVELKIEIGDGVDLFCRYMVNVSTNNELKGKCFLEGMAEEGGSFTLKKTNLEELNAFRSKNAEALDRLHAAARSVEFLGPAWGKILSSSVAWLDQTLGYDFKMIDDGILPDRDYAKNLADALDRRANLFAQKSGTEIPLAPNRRDDSPYRLKTYLVSVPQDFPGEGRKYPLLIRLHGGGGGRRPAHFNTPEPPVDSPFIVVKPISQSGWQPRALNPWFAELKRVLPIDEDRVYLTGGSMGGFGTYAWAMANPELFAAIGPMCGGGDIFRAPRLKNLPIWIHHGEKDEAVPFWFAERMLIALQGCGADVKYTFYPEGKHNLDPLIDKKAVEQWFLDHQRSKEPVPADPVEDLKLGADGIGPKVMITLPEQRFACIQAKVGQEYPLDSRLFKVFQNAGRRAQGYLQHQTLAASPEGMENLLLEIPKDLEVKNLGEDVKIIETPKCRALSFAMVRRSLKKDRAVYQSVMKELKERGEAPTGEIRETTLTLYSANLKGHAWQTVQRVEIVLK